MTQPGVPSPEQTTPESAVALDTVTGSDTLDAVQATLDEFFAVNRQVPHAIRLDLSIAAAEIGANIIEHAGGGHPVHLHMEVWLYPDEVRITFTDDGVDACVDLVSAALPDDDAERGRGLAIARAVLRELSYRRNAANHWTLISQRFSISR